MWSHGAIKPGSSNEIVSEDNPNENLSTLWRHVKIKNANRVTLIIYLWLKCFIFLRFWFEFCKTLERDGQEIKISVQMKKFHFWEKYTLSIKNENDV